MKKEAAEHAVEDERKKELIEARNQAESLRTKRRQQAEERAQKTAVKLMIPLVLFIFPAMFVVLGGPAVLNVVKQMKSNPGLGW